MKEIGKMDLNLDKVNHFILMVIDMLAHGKMENRMERDI